MPAFLERVRRPAFVGTNRCWPCTVVNGLLLWTGVTILTVLGQPLVALAAAAVGFATIWLRGYLIPYTPRFAPQLVSLLPGDPFDHDRGPGSLADALPDGDAGAPTKESVLEALDRSDVVTVDGEDVLLEPSVRGDWREEMRRLGSLALDDLAAVADGVTPESVSARGERRWGADFVVLDPKSRPTVLLSRPKAVVELAAARVLDPHLADERVRLAAGRPFRPLLDRCPQCEGALTTSASACCGEATPLGSTTAEKLVCTDCAVSYHTFE